MNIFFKSTDLPIYIYICLSVIYFKNLNLKTMRNYKDETKIKVKVIFIQFKAKN